MNSVAGNQAGGGMQLGFLDAVLDLLLVNPVFWLGIVVIGVLLVWVFRKHKGMSKIRVSILSVVFYYYLYVMLTNIVGIPTLRECMRLSGLGESFFHPNVNLIPFHDGFSLGFILNIFLFIPLGFLCPLISKHYQSVKNTFLIGFGLSFAIEIVQLFTLYRATDIDDLITNTIGALIGYFWFRFADKLVLSKFHSVSDFEEPRCIKYIPVIIIITAFIFGFFS